MKQIFNLMQKHLIRPILYSSVTKTVIGLCIVLLWNWFVNAKSVAPIGIDTGFFFVGVFYLTWAWIQYLILDGVKSLWFLQAATDSDLEDDEQVVVKLCSNMVCGLVLLVLGFCSF